MAAAVWEGLLPARGRMLEDGRGGFLEETAADGSRRDKRS